MICWTLGITEHHNGVDNVLALISLALLTGHVGRYGSGQAVRRIEDPALVQGLGRGTEEQQVVGQWHQAGRRERSNASSDS